MCIRDSCNSWRLGGGDDAVPVAHLSSGNVFRAGSSGRQPDRDVVSLSLCDGSYSLVGAVRVRPLVGCECQPSTAGGCRFRAACSGQGRSTARVRRAGSTICLSRPIHESLPRGLILSSVRPFLIQLPRRTARHPASVSRARRSAGPWSRTSPHDIQEWSRSTVRSARTT